MAANFHVNSIQKKKHLLLMCNVLTNTQFASSTLVNVQGQQGRGIPSFAVYFRTLPLSVFCWLVVSQ